MRPRFILALALVLPVAAHATTGADSDGDLLDDATEAQWGTDPLHPDTDRDGLPDGQEVLQLGTDPLSPDTDQDGLPDGQEVQVFGTDPLGPDTDQDGLLDPEELFVWGTDPRNPDTDGGGSLDGQEVFGLGTDPTDPADDQAGAVDLDGDGSPLPQDCDDTDPLVVPGGLERCDGVDRDCDGVADPLGCVVEPACARPVADLVGQASAGLLDACLDLEATTGVPVATCLDALPPTDGLAVLDMASLHAATASCGLAAAVVQGPPTSAHDLCDAGCPSTDPGVLCVLDVDLGATCSSAAEQAAVDATLAALPGNDLPAWDAMLQGVTEVLVTGDALGDALGAVDALDPLCDAACEAALAPPASLADRLRTELGLAPLPDLPDTDATVPATPTNADIARLEADKDAVRAVAEGIDCSDLQAAFDAADAEADAAEQAAADAAAARDAARADLEAADAALDAAQTELRDRMDALQDLFDRSVFSDEVATGAAGAGLPNRIGVSGAGGVDGFSIGFSGSAASVSMVRWFIGSAQVQALLHGGPGTPSLGALQSAASAAQGAVQAAAEAHAAAHAAAAAAQAEASGKRARADAALELLNECLDKQQEAVDRCRELEDAIAEARRRGTAQGRAAIDGARDAIDEAQDAVDTGRAVGGAGGSTGDLDEAEDDLDAARQTADDAEDALAAGDIDRARALAEEAERQAGGARNTAEGCPTEGEIIVGGIVDEATSGFLLSGIEAWSIWDAEGPDRAVNWRDQMKITASLLTGADLVSTLDDIRSVASLGFGALAGSADDVAASVTQLIVSEGTGDALDAIGGVLSDAIARGALRADVDTMWIAYGRVWYRQLTVDVTVRPTWICRDGAWQDHDDQRDVDFDFGLCLYEDGDDVTVWTNRGGRPVEEDKEDWHVHEVARPLSTQVDDFAKMTELALKDLLVTRGGRGSPHGLSWVVGPCE